MAPASGQREHTPGSANIQSANVTSLHSRPAREILTPEHGCGLDGLLRARSADLVGILNGVDYRVWDPANDGQLPYRYDAGNLAGKDGCKAALRGEMGFSQNAEAPLIAYVNRLTHQKMADVVIETLPLLAANGAQIVIHGDGDSGFEERFLRAAHACPANIAVRLGYSETLAHRIVGGCDLSLTPARFEPCGLTTMYSMRYGALPVARTVGGTADTVEDAGTVNKDHGAGSGFAFGGTTSGGLERCLPRAMSWYHDNHAWRRLQRRAMSRDFGWERSGRRYLDLYTALLGGRLQGLENSGRNAIDDPIVAAVARDAVQTGRCR